MTTHKLMIKTHLETNIKYLCYTRREDYLKYTGSGTKWKQHLKKFGNNIKTELIFESENFEEFKTVAINKSIEFDIVNSPDWANLKIEEGDGGDTVSNKAWITDGISDKYILKESSIPEGWKKGRTNCVFNNPKNQSKFSKTQSSEFRSNTMKKCWEEGKMEVKKENGRRGATSENNPARNKEVRLKISESMKLFYQTERGAEVRKNISEQRKNSKRV